MKNKVHPKDDAEDAEDAEDARNGRLKNVGKWLVAFMGLPLAYLVLPVSCCVRNPAAQILYEDHERETIDGITENLAVGCFGGVAIASCLGCCCGSCGKYGPREF